MGGARESIQINHVEDHKLSALKLIVLRISRGSVSAESKGRQRYGGMETEEGRRCLCKVGEKGAERSWFKGRYKEWFL